MPANAFDILVERGFVQDVTDADGLRDLMAKGPVTFYYGVDPTATSLHIGNLVGMMAMAWLQRSGHRAIALAGGATGRIGDPSHRDEERRLLDDEQIDANMERIREQLVRIIDIEDPGRGLLVDNHDWWRDLAFLDVLRSIGKHFSVNQMISRESVRRRLEEREHGISFTEFSYQLLQAYDFSHLHATEGCLLQIGGSDQWGNITAGVELTRRIHGARVHGLVWPLVERSDGKKISKTLAHDAPVLAADETSPYAFYQWFLNVPDADVTRFLKLYTFLPLDDIAELERSSAKEPEARLPQRALASEVTRIVHGDGGLEAALRATEILFGSDSFAGLDEATLRDAFASAPSSTIARDRLGEIGMLELMVDVGAASSNGEARRLIEQGAVRVNNLTIADTALVVSQEHLIAGGTLVLRTGKRKYFLARFE